MAADSSLSSKSSDPTHERQPNRQGDSLSQLQRLMLGDTYERFLAFQEKFEDPDLRAEAVGEVLPAAIDLRTQRDQQLAQTLVPTVEQVLGASVKRNPEPLIDALFPVIGPLIRKAIRESLRQMTQALNRTVEQSVSIKGLKWRLTAWRTGRSFSEVVLLKSLIFRVEQVFLIHGESGILLAHVTAPQVESMDAALVSGMLAAIRDFTRDSFHLSDSDALASVRMGDLAIIIEPGPHAVVAAVVRGIPPETMQVALSEVCEQIHREFGPALRDTAGEVAEFEPTKPVLAKCLLAQYDPQVKKSTWPAWAVKVGVAVAALCLIFNWTASRRQWGQYVDQLRTEPGIVVTLAKGKWRGFRISGLRDPLAADPAQIAIAHGLDPARIAGDWKAYQALEGAMIVSRAKHQTDAPDTVVFAYDSGELRLTGAAEKKWRRRARQVLPVLGGVLRYDDAALTIIDNDTARFNRLIGRIESARLFFKDGLNLSALGRDALTVAALQFRQAAQAAHRLERPFHAVLTGHTDDSGMAAYNRRLGTSRAKAVRELLIANRVAADILRVGDPQSGLGRMVTIKIVSPGSAEPN